MSLSICLITRDAERNLERALRSVAPLGAEVLVGDTGSRDRTVAIAQSLGAKVFSVPWREDFGGAQNQVLERATGDWVLWLNPDEELLSGQEQMPALLARQEVLAYTVRMQELTDPDDPQQGAVETCPPRLFRRLADLRFVGRLHPTFDPPLAETVQRQKREIFHSDLRFCRHAYLSILTSDKLSWAKRLLELELQDRPGQLHYLIEYGRTLLRLNDPKGHEILAQASEMVLAHQDDPNPPSFTVASLLEYLLIVSPQQSRSRISASQAAELAARWFPNSPPLLWILSLQAYQVERFLQAAALLERLVHLGRTGTYDRSASFTPSILGEPALLNLGNCYLRLHDPDRAERCFTEALQNPSYQEQAERGCQMAQALRARLGAGR